MQEFLATVMANMQDLLNKAQLDHLNLVLIQVLQDYDLTRKCTEIAIPPKEANEEKLRLFLAWKLMEGCSKKTAKHYQWMLGKFLSKCNKDVRNTTKEEIFMYIAMLKVNGASSRYLNNHRAAISSFFTWMENNNMIAKNPVRGIRPVKEEKLYRAHYSDIELEKLRRSTSNKRDRALVEFLYASGVRVSECCSVDISDINFQTFRLNVFGKGAKEREVYLSDTAVMYLQEYLKTRKDDNPALFVQYRSPFKRLDPSGVESLLKKLGKKAGVENVHPHRFRRTLATNLLMKGVPIEEVSMILGHEKIDTTLEYCNLDKSSVQNDYRKVMCS